jgi:phosphopantothenoylcysteine decarboxylase/phosphopantothenate--cysteine ligase
MKNAVTAEMKGNDILIMASAVADYKPAELSGKKIKKQSGSLNLELVGTDDILASLDKAGKKVIGFALETDNELENALAKLKKKNLDMIVLNSLKEEGAGFEHETNKVTIIQNDGNKNELPLLSKFQTANYILSEIKNLL